MSTCGARRHAPDAEHLLHLSIRQYVYFSTNPSAFFRFDNKARDIRPSLQPIFCLPSSVSVITFLGSLLDNQYGQSSSKRGVRLGSAHHFSNYRTLLSMTDGALAFFTPGVLANLITFFPYFELVLNTPPLKTLALPFFLLLGCNSIHLKT